MGSSTALSSRVSVGTPLVALRAAVALSVVCTMVALGAPSRARAGGFELPVDGTRALGRGGAFAARSDDPTALRYDPAGLAVHEGVNLALSTTPILARSCFDRAGTYAEPTASTIDMGEVCSVGLANLIPEFAFSWRILPQLGIGVAFLPPYGVGNRRFGDTSGTTDYAGASRWIGVGAGKIPSPARYDLIDESIVMGFPTVGIAFRPHPIVSIGASFGAGFASIKSLRMIRLAGGEDFASDVALRLSVLDAFVPRLGASVHVVPHDNLDITAFFVWQDAVRAKGTAQLDAGYYSAVSQRISVDGATLTIPQPWRAGIAIRYAGRTSPRSDTTMFASAPQGQINDPLSEEQWDIELDVHYERNSAVSNIDIALPTATACGGPCTLQGTTLGDLNFRLPHAWKDQWAFRLGGDYHLVPGMVALRAGVSFETNGVSSPNARIDFAPRWRLGIHAGTTVRLSRTDISFGYAFLQDFDLQVDPMTASARQLSVDGNGTIINAGLYRSSAHVLSVGAVYHFR